MIATNYAGIIRPLQFVLMGLLGLFFLWVLRVAVVEMRPPAEETASRRSRRRRTLALEFVEPEENAGQRIEIESVLTVGRSPECELSLADTYLSGRHARFTLDDGDLLLEDLGSTNGTYVNEQPLVHRTKLDRGDIVQVGGVLFEVVR